MRAEVITEALGMKPRFRWNVGDREGHTQAPLEGTYPTTYWCSDAVKGMGFDLEERLRLEIAGVEPHSDFLTLFTSTGGSIEYYIGWSTDAVNTGATFGADLLKRLGDLEIDLSLDVYGMPESPREPGADSRPCSP